MPLWKISHSPGVLEDVNARAALANSVTDWYTTHTGMPAFYVGVIFLAILNNALYIGGKARDASTPFVRLEVDQIHINHATDDDTAYKRNLDGLCKMLQPHLKGVSWEIHIDETDRRLWTIDGISPPAWRSEEEARWREAGKPLERL